MTHMPEHIAKSIAHRERAEDLLLKMREKRETASRLIEEGQRLLDEATELDEQVVASLRASQDALDDFKSGQRKGLE